MNREIKFRAWDKVNKKFVKHLHINIVSESDVYSKLGFLINEFDYCEYNKCDLIPKLPKEIELMQYTGLKDKNGVEIYENDVIKFTVIRGLYTSTNTVNPVSKNDSENYPAIGTIDYLGNIKLLNEDKMIKPIGNEKTRRYIQMKFININDYKVAEKVEVIGNIYQNPELIK